jgi:hypothetical protein
MSSLEELLTEEHIEKLKKYGKVLEPGSIKKYMKSIRRRMTEEMKEAKKTEKYMSENEFRIEYPKKKKAKTKKWK